MKKSIFLLIVLVVGILYGCTTQNGNSEINALQTQVGDLTSTQQALQNSVSANTVAAQEDAAAFIQELSQKVAEKGWKVSNVSENSFGVTTDEGGIYLIQYNYYTPKVSKLAIYSIWTGVGKSNLEPEILAVVNRANDEQNLAKVSVDENGDFWLETVLPFGNQLDVNLFVDYVGWFELHESSLLMNYFQDYLQQ